MEYFGGSTGSPKEYTTKTAECDGKKNSLFLDLPPLSAIYLKKRKQMGKNKVTGEKIVNLEGILVPNKDAAGSNTAQKEVL